LTVLLALALVTLALSGAGPSLYPARVVWTNQIPYDPHSSVSVGEHGVFVAAGSEARSYDFNGSLVWTRQVGNAEYGIAYGIALGHDGVYVVGYSYVLMLDFNGNLIWSRQFGAMDGSWPQSVSVDSTGLHVAGSSDFYPRLAVGIVEKFDSRGNEIWTRQIQATGLSSRPTGISAGPKGVYVVGENYCPTHSRCDPSAIQGGFLEAFDHDGSELWDRQFVGCLIECLGGQVSVAPTGIYIIGGPSFVGKYDFDDNLLWTVDAGPPETIPFGVSADSSGVYVVGLHYSLPFSAFVERLDFNGAKAWSLFFETSRALSASTNARGIFVTGDDFMAKVCASQSCIHN